MIQRRTIYTIAIAIVNPARAGMIRIKLEPDLLT